MSGGFLDANSIHISSSLYGDYKRVVENNTHLDAVQGNLIDLISEGHG